MSAEKWVFMCFLMFPLVLGAIDCVDWEKAHYKITKLMAYAVAPLLWLTGFRFSKDYRHGTTRFHRGVYACVDTVKANLIAGL